MDPKDDQLAGQGKNPSHDLPLPGINPAAELLRQKINAIYEHEPSAKQELAEVQAITGHGRLSKHQKYMQELADSGKTAEEIQVDWHDYYTRLSDQEKHEVWREFHEANRVQRRLPSNQRPAEQQQAPSPVHGDLKLASAKSAKKSPADIKKTIISSVSASQQLGAKQHFKSLIFGIGVGSIVFLVLLFGFFNERFLAPFITPNKTVSSTPIISSSTAAVGKDPKIIIPKINAEIPVVYGVGSVDEKAVQSALESGVVHYASTSVPGQKGNGVIVGHSSNNIFNNGQYKFAFVLLKKLETGDTFMMEKDGVRYTYKVYEKKIVEPTDLSVVGPNEKTSTITLITCDPPGTSINRLVVVGEQISPDPVANKAPPASVASADVKVIPGNAPTLWNRLTEWLF